MSLLISPAPKSELVTSWSESNGVIGWPVRLGDIVLSGMGIPPTRQQIATIGEIVD